MWLFWKYLILFYMIELISRIEWNALKQNKKCVKRSLKVLLKATSDICTREWHSSCSEIWLKGQEVMQDRIRSVSADLQRSQLNTLPRSTITLSLILSGPELDCSMFITKKKCEYFFIRKKAKEFSQISQCYIKKKNTSHNY